MQDSASAARRADETPKGGYRIPFNQPGLVGHELTYIADAILRGLEKAIGNKTVTYDFARLMEGAKEIKCSAFGEEIIRNLA